MIFGQNLVIYTVFYKESESEVKKCQILEPGGENYEKTMKIKIFNLNLFFNLTFFYLNVGLKPFKTL